MKRIALRVCIPLLAGCLATLPVAGAPVSFRADIAPILSEHCLACHGPKKSKGNYRVDTFNHATKPGQSDLPAFQPGQPDQSEALQRILADDEDDRMPQDADPLPAKTIALIQRWIEEGVRYDTDDPDASLASIMPPPTHPAPPATYPRSIPIAALAFSPDGTQLYASGYHEITVWNAATGKLARRIGQEGQRTYAISLSPDGTRLAAASGLPGRLGELRIFDLGSGELISVLLSATDIVLDAAFSPDGSLLAAGTAEGKIHLFETADWKTRFVNSSHSDWVTALAWNSDGTRLASASRDKSAKVFDAGTGERLVTYTGHSSPVRGVAFHPDDNHVCSSSSDGEIHLWKMKDAKKVKELQKSEGELYKLVSAGDDLYAVGASRIASRFSFKEQKRIREFSGHDDWVLCCAVSPQTGRLATGGFDGEIRLWNIEDGALILAFMAAP